MKILIFNWKDCKNPLAGGAEVVTEELLKRLVKNGYQITLLTSRFKGCKSKEIINGYKVIRVGNKWTVYWQAYRYYKKYLKGEFDLVIDEVNTIPFFAKFYVKEKNITLIYQLCRIIWFYQMFFPLSLFGYLLEPIYLYLLNDRYVLTESESTKIDLQRYGFKKHKIFVFPIGLEKKSLSKNEFLNQKKERKPIVLYFGSIRSMKRPDQVLKAFEFAKRDIKDLKFWIVGDRNSGSYFQKIMNFIRNSQYKKDITYFGKVDKEKKIELMQKSHIICATSIKEGWGLIVTEANSQGTPAIVYDVDGLRDSCKNKITGLVSKNNSLEDLAKNIIKLIKDKKLYQKYRYNAWIDSQNYTCRNSYEVFANAINKISKKL